MPVVTNRMALSTIGDGQLNSNQSLNCSTPLANKQRSKLRQNTDEFKSMLSLTPSKHKRRFPDMVTKSFSIEKSGTYYSKRSPAIKSTSFAEYNTSDTSPTLHLKSSASAFKNDKAGLAATKLKLRLQFALYKVQQNKTISTDTTSIHKDNAKIDELNFLNPILSPSSSKKGTPTASPNYEIHAARAMSSLLTPPEPKTYYTKSINVNLQSKTKTPSSSTTSLSVVAQNKAKKRDQKLKLFQIKKTSIHYSSTQKKLPLIRQKQDVNASKSTSSFNIFCPSISIYGSTNSLFNAPAPPPTTALPAITLNHKSETQLPPINKILKTPIKRANLSRSLRFQQSFNNAAPSVVDTAASRMPTTVDDTIDEDNDMTMLQNTTIHNSTIDQQESNSTIIAKDIDETKIEDDEEEEGGEKKTVLTSSPFHNNLGTPNSFSVAKSLLQLGGHRM
ncbi:hypothetical protein CORT_0B11010 [Candida orthopsilosis Co 90-125]|uniref:Uncharacterized protein n=1 Tax=Candida orthopsilosis (strain 90-125) TaxID=1136231 RepID=H8X278_CANO9|nr:hypothetical protein CORT_0B11010 [Candida orthopsilosis Co 90-125]CCG22800.1 hypothetical protein CORT_0B11010 [Candida orthopsilosis Co 90-125]